MDYKTKSIKEYIERHMTEAGALAEAWGSLERYKTKDGKDFKNRALNFTKGAIRPQRYNRNEKAIYVSACKDNKYYYDDLNIDCTVYHGSEEAKKYKAEGRLIERGEFMHPYYEMTPDEIEELIKNRGAYWRGIEKEYRDSLAKIEDVLNRAFALSKQLNDVLAEIPSGAAYEVKKILQ